MPKAFIFLPQKPVKGDARSQRKERAMLENEHQIILDYKKTQSLREVARQNYCCPETVRLVLIRHSIPRAPAGHHGESLFDGC